MHSHKPLQFCHSVTAWVLRWGNKSCHLLWMWWTAAGLVYHHSPSRTSPALTIQQLSTSHRTAEEPTAAIFETSQWCGTPCYNVAKSKIWSSIGLSRTHLHFCCCLALLHVLCLPCDVFCLKMWVPSTLQLPSICPLFCTQLSWLWGQNVD